MRDSQSETENSKNVIELQKDTRVFRRMNARSHLMQVSGFVEKGTEVRVGTAADIVTAGYNHDDHQFVSWEDEDPEQREDGIGYFMTQDLPANW